MYKSRSGFTIVELLIVIVIIGILAAITIVAYNGIQNRALTTTLQSDLTNASRQMEIANVTNGSYPTTLPSAIRTSPNVVLSLSQTASGYCINAEYTTSSSLQWYYDSSSGGLHQGLCSGAVISGSELGENPNLVTNTDFSSGWNLNLQDSTGRSLSVRPGASGDPYPTRPVLVLNNTSTNTTTWAVLQSTAVNKTAITAGTSYTLSYYVRKTGTTYNGGTLRFGVLDGNGQNVSIGTGAWATTSTSWQKVSGTATAAQNAPSSNELYLPLSTSEFTKTGWTLEFQDFELRQN